MEASDHVAAGGGIAGEREVVAHRRPAAADSVLDVRRHRPVGAGHRLENIGRVDAAGGFLLGGGPPAVLADGPPPGGETAPAPPPPPQHPPAGEIGSWP